MFHAILVHLILAILCDARVGNWLIQVHRHSSHPWSSSAWERRGCLLILANLRRNYMRRIKKVWGETLFWHSTFLYQKSFHKMKGYVDAQYVLFWFSLVGWCSGLVYSWVYTQDHSGSTQRIICGPWDWSPVHYVKVKFPICCNISPVLW